MYTDEGFLRSEKARWCSNCPGIVKVDSDGYYRCNNCRRKFEHGETGEYDKSDR